MTETVDPAHFSLGMPHHAPEFDEKRKVKALPRVRDKLGRFLPGKRLGAFTCIVPGVSLTDYSRNAEAKGWGAPCQQQRTTITLSNGVRVTVASGIAELTKMLMNECIRRGYVIRPADTGAYNCRKIAGTNRWSNHAWALAVDINWQLNPMRKPLTTNIPNWMVQLFNRFGFAWGGHYSGTPDTMHFEFMGNPNQANEATNLARRELAGGGGGGGGGGPVVGDLPVHAPGSRTVRKTEPAMRGTDIQKLQQVLNRWYPNLPALPATGLFGDLTDGRVRHYQANAKLAVDGVVGPNTWKALGF